ncbi:MAG: ArsC/Spx/MgsR family protein [Deltaproteobacteria bacterium]
MTIQIFGHTKCKATRAAQRFFADRRIEVHMVDILRKGLSRGEFDAVARAVGGVAALYDAQSPRVRERGLQYAQPNKERMTELLLEDPRLYRTPIVRDGARATVGVDETTWRAWASEAKK